MKECFQMFSQIIMLCEIVREHSSIGETIFSIAMYYSVLICQAKSMTAIENES